MTFLFYVLDAAEQSAAEDHSEEDELKKDDPYYDEGE